MTDVVPLPLVRRPLVCQRKGCEFPNGGRCARSAEFDDPEAQCIELVREEAEVPEDPSAPVGATKPARELGPFEWSGVHLRRDDARRLPNPLTVAVLGHRDAGKTTLLASFFLALAARTDPDFPWRFAGSRTLFTFLTLADLAAKWRGYASSTTIVPHTPKGIAAQFVHLALRTPRATDPRVVDLVISDVSGEDIAEYALNPTPDLEPTMEFVRNADAFVFLVDCVRLMRAKPESTEVIGSAYDSLLSNMLQMVSNVLHKPREQRAVPVVAVWTKFDVVAQDVPPPDEPSLDKTRWGKLGKKALRTLAGLHRLRDAGVPVSLFPVSAFPAAIEHARPFNVCLPFEEILRSREATVAQRIDPPIHMDLQHPFFAMRRGDLP